MATIKDEFIDLRVIVESFISTQTLWNKKHDERSTETLRDLEKKIDKLSENNAVLIEKFGDLKCDEHSTRIKLHQDLSDQKIYSVETRLNWLWGVTGATVIIAIVKSVYSFIKG